MAAGPTVLDQKCWWLTVRGPLHGWAKMKFGSPVFLSRFFLTFWLVKALVFTCVLSAHECRGNGRGHTAVVVPPPHLIRWRWRSLFCTERRVSSLLDGKVLPHADTAIVCC